MSKDTNHLKNILKKRIRYIVNDTIPVEIPSVSEKEASDEYLRKRHTYLTAEKTVNMSKSPKKIEEDTIDAGIPEIGRTVGKTNPKPKRIIPMPIEIDRKRFSILDNSSIITFIINKDDIHTTRYRVYNTITWLKSVGIKYQAFYDDDISNKYKELSTASVVIFCRCLYTKEVGKAISFLKDNKIPTIFDVDDLIFDEKYVDYLGPVRTKEDRRSIYLEKIRSWRKTFDACDYITCSTLPLADHALNLGKKSYVVKNSINAHQLELSEKLILSKTYGSTKSEIKIGYFSGTNTHNIDFLEAAPSIYEILKTLPKVKLYIVGHLDLPEYFSPVLNKIIRLQLYPYLQMLECLSTMDINLAPLEMNNPFTDCKSELKIFEASIVHVPTIASATNTYAALIDNEKDGYLASTKSDWDRYLHLLIENPSLRKSISIEARKKAIGAFYFGEIAKKAFGIYQTIEKDFKGGIPKVSIVSILFKKEDLVDNFLKSIYQQTYGGEIEVILIDDMSPDNSVKSVENFLESNGNPNISVKIIKNYENVGNCISRNRGILETSGEIVIIVDADVVINRDFVYYHVQKHINDICDIVIGPLNLETYGEDPIKMLAEYEASKRTLVYDRSPQDIINDYSFLNCVTRNFSIKKEKITEELFDPQFTYSMHPNSGFGWEDIEMGYRLYKKGYIIKYTDRAFSLHQTHPSAINEKEKPKKSLINFYKLFKKHPELSKIVRRWAVHVYHNIIMWGGGPARMKKNIYSNYIDSLLKDKILPVNFLVNPLHTIRVLSYRWHCAHQYELHKLPYEFTLVTGLGPGMTMEWEYEQRPLRRNVSFKHVSEIKQSDYDIAILHFDENVLYPQLGNGVMPGNWGASFKWFMENIKSIPKIAICHGTPQFKNQYTSIFMENSDIQVLTKERQDMIDYMGNTLVICNSHQARKEWKFSNSKTIWHGFDPTEFYPCTYSKGILTLGNAMKERPHYRGYFLYNSIINGIPEKDTPSALSVQKPTQYIPNTNEYAYAKFRNYVDAIRQFSIYLNPTLRSPMPRSRGEAMMCGLVIVSADNHDVSNFIQNRINGFYSNEPGELRDYLLYLLKNPEITEKVGRAGRDTAIDIFNHDRYLEAWRTAISEILT